jgi:hypothetical protein
VWVATPQVVLNEQLTSLMDTVRAELSLSAAQVLAAAVALKQQLAPEEQVVSGVMQDASDAVSALESTLHGLGAAAATALPLLQLVSKLLRVLATAADGDCQAALLRASASRVLTCREAFAKAVASGGSADELAAALAKGGACDCASSGGGGGPCDAASCVKAVAQAPQQVLPPLVALHELHTAVVTRQALLSVSEGGDAESAQVETQLAAALSRVTNAATRAVQEMWDARTFLQLRTVAAGGGGGGGGDALAAYYAQLAAPLAQCLQDAALTAAVDAVPPALAAASQQEEEGEPSPGGQLMQLVGYVHAAIRLLERLQESATRCGARLQGTVMRAQQQLSETASDANDDSLHTQLTELQALMGALGAAVGEAAGGGERGGKDGDTASAQWDDTLRAVAASRGRAPLTKQLSRQGSHVATKTAGGRWAEAAGLVSRQQKEAQRVRVDLTEHFVQLSTVMGDVCAVAMALLPASEGLTWAGPGVGLVVKEAAAEAAAELQNTVNEMKVLAVSKLEAMTDQAAEALPVPEAVLESCGALVAPTLGLVGDAVRSHKAKGGGQLWRVREVAVLQTLRVLDALRRGGEETVEVREALQAALLRSAAYEPNAQVRALLNQGAALASELNACSTAAAAAEASQAADAERKRGWADTQQSVKHEVEERLRQLERMRSEAEREPDVLQKQLKLAECRELHAGLTQCSSNVKDVGTALGVVVGFLSGMDSKLDALGAQLSELQAAVRELGADMKRLVGKPVLELLDEQLKGRLAALQQLRAEVYIPAEGVRADENGKFLVSDTNPAFDLMQEVKERFLQSEATSVLLLSGPAGSGACQARATLGLLWATGSSSGHNGWAPPLLFVVWAGP